MSSATDTPSLFDGLPADVKATVMAAHLHWVTSGDRTTPWPTLRAELLAELGHPTSTPDVLGLHRPDFWLGQQWRATLAALDG